MRSIAQAWITPLLIAFSMAWIAVGSCGRCEAVEKIKFKDGRQREQNVTGESLVEARDGGLLLLGDDGRIWTIQPGQIESKETDDTKLTPVNEATVQQRLLKEMPAGFEIHQTNHYLICHNTSVQYVTWVGSLFEQLYRGFNAYWKNQGLDLEEPRFPLVGLVFADRKSFEEYARPEVGEAVGGIIGYYNLETNRITTFNMPNPERNIATIIHEATHQLAYNTGLQQRFADNPMWVSEGLAVFFESPDFSSSRGWRTIGRVNAVNLQRFKKYLLTRPADSLSTLLSDDKRFRNADSAISAYSEAWALNYFLLKTKRKEYVAYLQELSKGEPLKSRSPRERIEMFEKFIGADLQTIERQFVPFVTRLR